MFNGNDWFKALCLQPYLSWATSTKANKTWNKNSSKTKKQKTQLSRECLVLTQKIVFSPIFWVLTWVKQKNNLLNQNQTISEKLCFFWFLGFAQILCGFWFAYWFTWLPSVSLGLLNLLVVESQTLIKVSHSRVCALCETKFGIGCAVMFMHLNIEEANKFQHGLWSFFKARSSNVCLAQRYFWKKIWHKVASFCIVPLYQGVAALLWMN